MDGGCETLIAADGVYRGNKLIHLLEVADKAIQLAAADGAEIKRNIVVEHLPRLHHSAGIKERESYQEILKKSWVSGRDFWWHLEMETASDKCKLAPFHYQTI